MYNKQKLRAITIDDDKLSTLMIEKITSKVDSVDLIASYNNPVKGLSSLIMDKPDLIFLDLDMPFLTGTEILRILAVLDDPPKTIVISGKDNFEQEIENLEIVGFFRKPLDQEALIDMLSSL